jgi:hypothetical protein
MLFNILYVITSGQMGSNEKLPRKIEEKRNVESSRRTHNNVIMVSWAHWLLALLGA